MFCPRPWRPWRCRQRPPATAEAFSQRFPSKIARRTTISAAHLGPCIWPAAARTTIGGSLAECHPRARPTGTARHCAAGVCRDAVRQRRPDVPCRADGSQDGAATAWRLAGGVEHMPGILPGGAAARLHLCASPDPPVVTANADPCACCRAAAAGGTCAAARSRRGRTAAWRGAGAVAADAAVTGGGTAGVRHFGDRAVAAALVRRSGP